MNYRPDIDGFRTLAVVSDVLYHARIAGFTGGFIGVDIFFVFSGFLITTIIHRELVEERFSLLRFYERRVECILPALFAVILASVVAGWFILVPADYDKMGQSILSALLFVSSMWFWRNSGDYSALGARLKALQLLEQGLAEILNGSGRRRDVTL